MSAIRYIYIYIYIYLYLYILYLYTYCREWKHVTGIYDFPNFIMRELCGIFFPSVCTPKTNCHLACVFVQQYRTFENYYAGPRRNTICFQKYRVLRYAIMRELCRMYTFYWDHFSCAGMEGKQFFYAGPARNHSSHLFPLMTIVSISVGWPHCPRAPIWPTVLRNAPVAPKLYFKPPIRG